MSNEQIQVSIMVKLVQKTAKAVLVNNPIFGEETWIPDSQIHDNSEIYLDSKIGDVGLLVIPAWLALRKGWVGPT